MFALRHNLSPDVLGELFGVGSTTVERYQDELEILIDVVLSPCMTRFGRRRRRMFGNFGAEVADHSDALRATVEQALRQWTQAVAATLAEARDAGAIAADLDPGKTARFVVGAWEGALISGRVDRSGHAFDAFFDITFATLLTPAAGRDQ